MGYRKSHWWDWETIKALAIVGIFALMVVGGISYAFWYAYQAGGKLSIVITHNIGFWITVILSFGFGFYRKFTNPREFTWLELPVQLLVSFVVITGLFVVFFKTSTELVDHEVWNGYVTRAEYYERWTEKCSRTVCDSKDKDGHCTSSHTEYYNVDHEPEWKVQTTAGNFDSNQTVYRTYVQHFGNEQKKDLNRYHQVSLGDGNMFFASYDNSPEKLIPASREHEYINYLRASDSVRKNRNDISEFQKLIRPYPRVYNAKFGPIEINRVINSGVKLPKEWETEMDKQMDIALTRLGQQKQVNIIVYLANTSDPKFGSALEQAWVNGKKNDVVVILGITNFPEKNFVHVMAWTENESFKTELRDRLKSLPLMTDPRQIGDIIIDQVAKPPNQGGYERLPMANLEYMVSDITLPWWCQILIVILGFVASLITSFILINNS